MLPMVEKPTWEGIGSYRGYVGITESKMENTIYVGFKGLGCRV